MVYNVFPQYNGSVGICLDLHMARAAAGDLFTFDLPFMCRLFLVSLKATRSVVCASKDLISHVEDAPMLDLQWP